MEFSMRRMKRPVFLLPDASEKVGQQKALPDYRA
jgi:hypothetical protein